MKKKIHLAGLVLGLLLFAQYLGSCSVTNNNPTIPGPLPTYTFTFTPSFTPTITNTPRPTHTPTNSPTNTPTNTPTATPTP